MLLTVFGMLSWGMVIKGKSLTRRHTKASWLFFFLLTTASIAKALSFIHWGKYPGL